MVYTDRLLAVMFGDDMTIDSRKRAVWCWRDFDGGSNFINIKIL